MMRNEPYFRTQRILRRQPLHASCSAMRSTDDTREGCNQKTTYIMPYDWEHAHDVMRREPEQCFTDESLASWFYLVTNHGFKSVYIMS